MPCRDGGPTEGEIASTLRYQNRFLEAVLCGILSTSFDLDLVDWKEAGVSQKEVVKWWKRHRAQDVLRRKREREYKVAQLADKIRLREQLERDILEMSRDLGDPS